jgi:hypothetical protein
VRDRTIRDPLLLAEDLRQRDDWHPPAAENVGEHVARPDRRQLVAVADQHDGHRRRHAAQQRVVRAACRASRPRRRPAWSPSSGCSALRAKRPAGPGVNSSNRCKVDAGCRVASSSASPRARSGPPAAAAVPSGRGCCASARTIVVLPTPGPPVITDTGSLRHRSNASRWPGGQLDARVLLEPDRTASGARTAVDDGASAPGRRELAPRRLPQRPARG